MELNTNTNDLKVAENLIVIDGEQGDVIIGNGKFYIPVYIENGNAFRMLLDKMKSGKFDSVEKRLFDLFWSKRIIVDKDKAIETIPDKANTCCGITGEQTLVLPLGEEIEDEIYKKAVYYQMTISENNSTFNVKFSEQDPAICWPLLEKVAKLIEIQRAKTERRIRLRYHLYSKLQKLPNEMVRWVKKHNVDLTVFLPLPMGLKRLPSWFEPVKNNVKKLSKEGVPICFVTPAVKNNISDLFRIAENYANINNSIGFEFPALQSAKYCWTYDNTDELPDPDEYSQKLLDLYKARIVSDDMFSPVNELRHRVINGGYHPFCSLIYDHVTLITNNGDIYPCMLAAGHNFARIGSVKAEPESNIEDSLEERNDILTRSWLECKQCKWRYLCGAKCPLALILNKANISPIHDKLTKKYICQPRLELLKSIIWDIFREAAKGAR